MVVIGSTKELVRFFVLFLLNINRKELIGKLERWACANHMEVQLGQVKGPSCGLEQSQAQIQAGRRMD